MIPCWIFRYEAEGYADAPWRTPLPDHLPCACDPGCDCPCAYDWIYAMCVLHEGHAGDHQFVKHNEIMLVFRAVPHVA